MNLENVKYDLIVTIVNKGKAENVVKYVKKAGAEGSTILNGRGSGDTNRATQIFGIVIEPEKEIILTVVSKAKTDDILEMLYDKMDLEKPGKGIVFVLDVEKCIGIHNFVTAEKI